MIKHDLGGSTALPAWRKGKFKLQSGVTKRQRNITTYCVVLLINYLLLSHLLWRADGLLAAGARGRQLIASAAVLLLGLHPTSGFVAGPSSEGGTLRAVLTTEVTSAAGLLLLHVCERG